MPNDNDISSKVFERLAHDRVRMRSHAFFLAQLLLFVIVSAAVIVLSIFVLSFVIFSIHESGEQFLLGFGGRGVLTFVSLFPWLPFLIDLGLLAFAEWLFRRFGFGYQLPVLRIFGIILAAVFILSVLFSMLPFHSTLLDRADRGDLPFIGDLYEAIHASHADHGFFRGTISSINDSSFTITHDDQDRDADDGTWLVLPPPGFALNNLHVTEKVYVAGQIDRGEIHAYGIQTREEP